MVRTAVLLAPYKGKIRSITTGNGTEFWDHQYITERLGRVSTLRPPSLRGRRVR